MLTRIIDAIAAAFGRMLEARLERQTVETLGSFGRRVEAALAGGDLTLEGLGGAALPAVADRPSRRKAS